MVEYRLFLRSFQRHERSMHLDGINIYSPAAICRAASAYISDGYPSSCMAMLSRCETLGEVLGMVTTAYESLPASERALYAQTLSELRKLTAVEKALALTVPGNAAP